MSHNDKKHQDHKLTEAERRKKAREDREEQKKRNKDLRPAIFRGAGIDVATHYQVKATPVEQIGYPIAALPSVPGYIRDWELVTTDYADVNKVMADLQVWAQEYDITWTVRDEQIYAKYQDIDSQKTCKVVIKSFKTEANSHVLLAERMEGCGIAFSRFYKHFCEKFSNVQKSINTFEPPAFIDTHDHKEDGCLDHKEFSPTNWAIQSLTNISFPAQKFVKQLNGASEEEMKVFEEVEDVEPKQQVQIITQAFEILNRPQDEDFSDAEKIALGDFKKTLIEVNGYMSPLEAFAFFPNTAVFAQVTNFIANNEDVELSESLVNKINTFANTYEDVRQTLGPLDELDHRDAYAAYERM